MPVILTERLEKRIGYTFRDRSILREALTHSSSAMDTGEDRGSDNQRLEFLGDAYLDAAVGLMLFEALPAADEGELTRRRAQMVCEGNLAEVAVSLDLGSFLILGKGEEKLGGREKPSILGDAVEALIGAILMDGGYDEAERFIRREFSGSLEASVKGLLFTDHKSRLQELLQKDGAGIRPVYTVIDESGPDHDKTFTVSVYAKGTALGRGSGKSKKEAEQNAARDALLRGVANVL